MSLPAKRTIIERPNKLVRDLKNHKVHIFLKEDEQTLCGLSKEDTKTYVPYSIDDAAPIKAQYCHSCFSHLFKETDISFSVGRSFIEK